MRAWQLHETSGPDGFRLDDIPLPEPGRGEVRIELRTSALNHLDLWVSNGMPAPHHMPHIAGADGAGVVSAVGEGVTSVTTGDDVIVVPSTSCGSCTECLAGNIVACRSFGILGEHTSGTLADQIVLPARNVVPKPEALSWEQAGSFGLVTGTAHRMLTRARVQAGDSVLIVGIGGGVSSAALGLALAMGADVYVTSRSQDKIDWAVANGATAGFDSSGEFAKELKAAGVPIDVAIESVGPATFGQTVRAMRNGGRIAICGATSGPKMEVTVPVLFFKQLEIIGSTMFTHGEFADVLRLVSSGKITPVVDEVFPFDQLPDALARLEAGDQLGKIVLTH